MHKLAPYWLRLHGLARRVDGDQALLGALGVAAFAYPHQIDNVVEMTTDTACRFLLADEVGLGKTIQTLMVLRALAAQRNTGLRVALITPDDLAHQWIEELLCRTDVGSRGVPVEPDEDSAPPAATRGRIAVELYRQARLAAGHVRLNPRYYDVLVVDEYPKLSQQIRDIVAQVSRTIPHVLLLSATPAMHDEAMRRAILEILEPDLARRAESLGEDLLDLLAARESVALGYVRGDTEEPRGLETPAGQARPYYARSHGLFRRVIRTRRSDYPDALPQRRYKALRVVPTDGDADRLEAARRYLRAAASEAINVRSAKLLQTALASPQALINRVSTLNRATPKMAQALRVLDAAARDPGDAKLDALIDHLRARFAQTPDARIVVVADDNRSVDDLAGAIARLVEVKVATKRRAYGGSDTEMDVHVAELRDEIEPFESGEARVLVAADVAAEGHNFQFASELIFYVLPWDPRDVDQWIGRLDRLGGRGRPGKRTILITPIVAEDSIEARILDVYEAADLFSGGRVFDEDAWTALADAIDVAAYGSGGDWNGLVADTQRHHQDDEAWRGYSQLPAPWRVDQAKARYAALEEQSYALAFEEPPTPKQGNWFAEREIGARRILTLADELGVLRLKKRTDDATGQKYRTLWYPHRPEPEDILVPELDAGNSGRHAALLLRRGDLHSPPNSNIGSRRLHFFDHGDPLHDSVVATFAELKWPSTTQYEHVVRFPDDHPGATFRGERIVLLTSVLSPRSGPAFDPAVLTARLSPNDSQTEREVTEAAIRRSYEEFLADARWFTDLAPPEFFVLAATAGPQPQVIDPGLFIGTAYRQTMPDHVSSRALGVTDAALAAKARDHLMEDLRAQRSVGVDHRARRLVAALALRRFKTRSEAREAMASAEAVERAGLARGGNLAFDRARRRANELAVLLADLGAEMRQKHLDQMVNSLVNTPLQPEVVVLKIQ